MDKMNRYSITCTRLSDVVIDDTANLHIDGNLNVGIPRSALCGRFPSHFEIRKNSSVTISGDVSIGAGSIFVVNSGAKLTIGHETYFT